MVCTFDGEYGVHEAKVFSFNSKIGALTRHNCNLPKPVADKFFGERSFALDEEQVDEALLESVKAAAEKEMREAN